MQVQSWQIASWPIIERVVDPVDETATDFTHLGTTVSVECDDFGRLLGHTIWGGTASGIGVAWDWVEALEGIFTLSDPMGIASNIGYVDTTGAPVTDFVAAVQLNRIAHSLPWQAEVAKATSVLRLTASRSDLETVPGSRRHRIRAGAPAYPHRAQDSAFQNL